MKNTCKRITSLLLAMCMCLSMVSGAYAEEAPEALTDTAVIDTETIDSSEPIEAAEEEVTEPVVTEDTEAAEPIETEETEEAEAVEPAETEETEEAEAVEPIETEETEEAETDEKISAASSDYDCGNHNLCYDVVVDKENNTYQVREYCDNEHFDDDEDGWVSCTYEKLGEEVLTPEEEVIPATCMKGSYIRYTAYYEDEYGDEATRYWDGESTGEPDPNAHDIYYTVVVDEENNTYQVKEYCENWGYNNEGKGDSCPYEKLSESMIPEQEEFPASCIKGSYTRYTAHYEDEWGESSYFWDSESTGEPDPNAHSICNDIVVDEENNTYQMREYCNRWGCSYKKLSEPMNPEQEKIPATCMSGSYIHYTVYCKQEDGDEYYYYWDGKAADDIDPNAHDICYTVVVDEETNTYQVREYCENWGYNSEGKWVECPYQKLSEPMKPDEQEFPATCIRGAYTRYTACYEDRWGMEYYHWEGEPTSEPDLNAHHIYQKVVVDYETNTYRVRDYCGNGGWNDKGEWESCDYEKYSKVKTPEKERIPATCVKGSYIHYIAYYGEEGEDQPYYAWDGKAADDIDPDAHNICYDVVVDKKTNTYRLREYCCNSCWDDELGWTDCSYEKLSKPMKPEAEVMPATCMRGSCIRYTAYYENNWGFEDSYTWESEPTGDPDPNAHAIYPEVDIDYDTNTYELTEYCNNGYWVVDGDEWIGCKYEKHSGSMTPKAEVMPATCMRGSYTRYTAYYKGDVVEHWEGKATSKPVSGAHQLCYAVVVDYKNNTHRLLEYCENGYYDESYDWIRCDHETISDPIKAILVDTATCGKDGVSYYLAEYKVNGKVVASEKWGEKVSKATGKHAYGKYTVTKKPTTTATGVETAVCSGCGKKITRTVSKLTTGNKAQPMTVKADKTSVKYDAKKAQTVKLTVSKAQGTVTYKTSSKSLTVKSGVVTIAKGTKPGKYTVTVTAAGNSSYQSGSKTITIEVTKLNQSMTVKADKTSLKVDKKKAQTVTVTTKDAKGKVTVTAAKKYSGVTVSGTKISFAKGVKGTFSFTVKAAGDSTYNSASKTVKITIK